MQGKNVTISLMRCWRTGPFGLVPLNIAKPSNSAPFTLQLAVPRPNGARQSLSWRFTASAVKQLSKLDKNEARRITTFLRQRIGTLGDPRTLGKPLNGPLLGEFWRYRVGDYRITVTSKTRPCRSRHRDWQPSRYLPVGPAGG